MILPRKAVLSLSPYAAPEEGRYDKIRLDFNENTQSLVSGFQNLEMARVCAYPEYDIFSEKLSRFLDLPKAMLLLTNGSDEALSLIAMTFIEPNVDRAIISSPTFSMIPHYLTLAQAKIQTVPVTGTLDFDIPALQSALENQAKLMILASPDNPTGATISSEQILTWCQSFPETLFVIDEAYADFTDTSVLGEVGRFQNLLVTRTFSKAWGAAGLRLGYIAGNPELIEFISRVRSPYSVNALSVEIASELLDRSAEVTTQAKAIMVRKSWILEAIKALGTKVIPGSANFFLLSLGYEASDFTAFCKQHGILVRDRSAIPQLWGMVRVSVGTQSEMEAFLDCLKAFREKRALVFDLDDTLVDTRESYDATIAELVLHYSGQPLAPGELKALRGQGGFNDDWDATVALLAKRNITMSREEIEAAGKAFYLKRASSVERLLVDEMVLETLREQYRLLVMTGRPRDEYEPIWGDRLPQWFEQVYCQDDFPQARRKPAPDLLLNAMADAGITGGIYVGNSVDDMQAARHAGLIPIGVQTTHEAELLLAYGAVTVLDSLNDIKRGLGQ